MKHCRKTASITALDARGNQSRSGTSSTPTLALDRSSLAADSNSVPKETLELAHNGFITRAGPLVKAFIQLKDGTARLTCAFNPREYTISKSATWHKTPAKGAKSAPKPEFVGANPRSMQMELFFEAWESSGDVSKAIDTLMKWTTPTDKSLTDSSPNPPIVVFHWGTKSYFDAYVKQVSAKYTMFEPDGTPSPGVCHRRLRGGAGRSSAEDEPVLGRRPRPADAPRHGCRHAALGRVGRVRRPGAVAWARRRERHRRPASSADRERLF